MEEIKCITILRSGYLLKKVRSSPEKKGDQPTFFFQYGQNYNPEKKYAVPLRTIIGKAHPSDNTLMYPNEKYQEYFPDAVLPEELPEAYRSCCLRIGAYAIICYVLNEYKLSQLLARWFPKDNGLLMDLVAYLIVNEDNAGQYYPDFAFCHPLFSDGMRIYSDSKVCRFLKSVTKEQTFGFLNDWNSRRDHKQRIYISYDSTNKNCQAGEIDLIEYGKAEDDKGIPVFNIAIAFDNTNRVPLFYEEYPRSITDVSQFIYTVDEVSDHDYFDLHYDRKGHLISYEENKDFIQQELRLCGYFCIITSEKMTAAEALIQYKGRDVSEKLFSADKSFIGCKSMRVQTAESLSAKVFIEFIALIVRNRIYNLLKETMLRLETRSNFMTVPAALRELEKIEMVRRSNGQYRLDHAVSKKQKTILSAFGLSDRDIRVIAIEISNLLVTNQSLRNMIDAKEEESYGEDTFDNFD